MHCKICFPPPLVCSVADPDTKNVGSGSDLWENIDTVCSRSIDHFYKEMIWYWTKIDMIVAFGSGPVFLFWIQQFFWNTNPDPRTLKKFSPIRIRNTAPVYCLYAFKRWIEFLWIACDRIYVRDGSDIRLMSNLQTLLTKIPVIFSDDQIGRIHCLGERPNSGYPKKKPDTEFDIQSDTGYLNKYPFHPQSKDYDGLIFCTSLIEP